MIYDYLNKINEVIYKPHELIISSLSNEKESIAYEACTFNLLGKRIIFRKGKVTPTKPGHFVTIWKRCDGITTPLNENDHFDYLIIGVENGSHTGQFVFSKAVLIQHGLIASTSSKGKRGVRVYAPWSKPNNKTALKSQKWQCSYFLDLQAYDEDVIKRLKVLMS